MTNPDHIRGLIRKAVALVGSQAKLGAAVGVKQASIWQAIKAGRVSGELAVGIHHATNGEVPASSLRPDLWVGPEQVPPRSLPDTRGAPLSPSSAGTLVSA